MTVIDISQSVKAARIEMISRRVNNAKTFIYVTFQKEGFHSYPAAATDPALADVSFLAHRHRHMFHFKVQIEVFHDDRELEFIQVKRWLESLYGDSLELENLSCEMMSDQLFAEIAQKYPDRDVWIDISEDGENGSFKLYPRFDDVN